jgi:hypothetical protein
MGNSFACAALAILCFAVMPKRNMSAPRGLATFGTKSKKTVL